MKIYHLLLLLEISFLISCNAKQNEIKNEFSTRQDTTYLINSTEIDYINRTFYSNVSKEGPIQILTLQQRLNKGYYTISAYDGYEWGWAKFNSDAELLSFFKDLITVYNSPSKNLVYTFGKSIFDSREENDIGEITSTGISIRRQDLGDREIVFPKMTLAEARIMQTCYNSYVLELKKKK